MALKDLTIDNNSIQEELIETLVSPYVRYFLKQKQVVFLPDNINKLTLPQKIILYLLALRGWEYIEGAEDIEQEAQPKEIATTIMENGSTIRSHLQVLLKRSLIQKKQTRYSISPVGIHKIQDFLKNSGN